ncbi:hypothetical protein ACFWZ2_29550 [Streptomyces sp. NPDC059002]
MEEELAPYLPLVSHVDTVRLIVTDGAGKGWRDLGAYRLGADGHRAL